MQSLLEILIDKDTLSFHSFREQKKIGPPFVFGIFVTVQGTILEVREKMAIPVDLIIRWPTAENLKSFTGHLHSHRMVLAQYCFKHLSTESPDLISHYIN